LIARRDRSARQRHANGGQSGADLGRLEVRRAKVEEVAPLAGILGTGDLAGLRIDNGEPAVPDDAALGELSDIELLAHHRLDRVPPKPDDRTTLQLLGWRI